METVLEYLRKNSLFYISTIEDNKPRVRPFGAVAEFEGKLYITTNNQKNVYKQILANPNIEICTMGKDGTWIRVEAKAIRDDRREARVQMMNENTSSLSSMYNVDDNIFEVLFLQDATATIYSFGKEPVVIQF
ncbi:MAG: pyridoxamine 5'-phosphate oxidase family protein [Lachnotalea sp.]